LTTLSGRGCEWFGQGTAFFARAGAGGQLAVVLGWIVVGLALCPWPGLRAARRARARNRSFPIAEHGIMGDLHGAALAGT
jgi:hypothetical protein